MPNDILKRLEIIKNAIAMEENDLIVMQVKKIKTLSFIDNSLQHILDLISVNKFENVIQLIEQYKQDRTSLTIYEDPQVLGLKLELKLLENKLNELTDTKAELDRVLNEFNNQYFHFLGAVIENILKIKAELCDDNEKNEAKKEYDDFHQGYEKQLQNAIQNLTDIEKIELKKTYRQASSLCHPDKLDESFKKEGEEFFKELNLAYTHQDLNRVKQILAMLEAGKPFSNTSDTINDKAMLQIKITSLRERILNLEHEIWTIEHDENYLHILSIDNREEYFHKLKQELEQELSHLRALRK